MAKWTRLEDEIYVAEVINEDPTGWYPEGLFIPCPEEVKQDDVIYKDVLYPCPDYAKWRSFNKKTKQFEVDEDAKKIGEAQKRIVEIDNELDRIDTYSIRPIRAIDASGPDGDVAEDRAILAHLEGLAADLREERASLQSLPDELTSESPAQ